MDRNKTEMIALAKKRFGVELGRHLDERTMEEILEGAREPRPSDMCHTSALRPEMEEFLGNHIKYVHQTPGCDAKCTTWGCTAQRCLVCYRSLKRFMV